jgi:hypothetical protein
MSTDWRQDQIPASASFMQVNLFRSTRNFRRGLTEVVRHIDCSSLAYIAHTAIHWTGEKVFYVY